jgi:hypothetical protein
MRLVLLGCAMVLLAASPAHAQVLRGRVTQGDSVAIPGVLVLLIADGNRVASRTLSDERGEYRVAAPTPGRWWVRTVRIGFQPSALEAVDLAAGQELLRDLSLRSAAFALDTVRVASRARCAPSAASREVAAVWQQARIALTAAQVTAGNQMLGATTLRHDRAVDARGRNERLVAPTRRESGFTIRGWTSPSPDSLHRGGYVHLLRDGTLSWYAPDIDVLLSDRFVDDHCFRLTRTKDAIGVQFAPESGRRDVAEVAGTVWLDIATAELRHMDFRYVNAPGVAGGDPGGDMRFVRLPNGGWAVERWSIRMPVFVERQRPSSGVPGEAPRKERVHVETRIASGELALVTHRSDTLYRAGVALVSGPRAVPILGPVAAAPGLGAARRDTNQPVTIAAVTATATPLRHEFDVRRAAGQGQFITREDFDKHPSRQLPDFMSQVSGARLARSAGAVWVTSGRGATGTNRGPVPRGTFERAGQRSCYVDVWLDGVMVYGRRADDPLFDISRISAETIQGIEFYASAALTPAQYQRYGAECGTLLIWTRRPDG